MTSDIGGVFSSINSVFKAYRRGALRIWDWTTYLRLGGRKHPALSAILELPDIPWDGFGLYLQRVIRTGVRAARSAEDERAARAGALTAQRCYFSPFQGRTIQLLIKNFTSDQDAYARQLGITEAMALMHADWEVTSAITLPDSSDVSGDGTTYGEIQLRKPIGVRSIRFAAKSVGPNLVMLAFEAPIENPWSWPDLTIVALKQVAKLQARSSFPD